VPTEKTSLSLRAETKALLRSLSERTGMSQSVVVDMALMALAARLETTDERQEHAERALRPVRKKP